VCNLYSITTNQEAIRALFRVVNRYVGNLPPMPGVFPDYPAPVVQGDETFGQFMFSVCQQFQPKNVERGRSFLTLVS
jgi:hypothetical protein